MMAACFSEESLWLASAECCMGHNKPMSDDRGRLTLQHGRAVIAHQRAVGQHHGDVPVQEQGADSISLHRESARQACPESSEHRVHLRAGLSALLCMAAGGHDECPNEFPVIARGCLQGVRQVTGQGTPHAALGF